MSCSVELRQRRQQGMAEDPHRLAAMMNKSQRLVLGLLILLLVDIIWVSSSELTKYIYREAAFEKPFFSTYIKTSMFTLYLLGLCFWPPWRDQCNKPATYMFIDPNIEDDNFYSEANTSLSDSTFVPIKTPDHCDRSSGTESDDSSIRSVRFSKLAEVRHMSESDATEALLARLSYQASVRAGEHAQRQANKFSVQKVAKIALMFCLLWFMANYTYQISLAQTEAGIVTVLSSTSSLFTLFLAALFPSNGGDKFTLSKLVAVSVSIFGLVLVGLSDLSIESNRVPTGIILALVSAFFYAAYLVFLRRKVDHEDKMDIPMFFGFVGLFNLTLLWPLFFILHYGHWEEFEWPDTHQWTFLIINGLIGTVLSEVLWLWGCFLTSSLIATLAVSLTMPMSMLADVLLKKVEYPCIFYLGTIPMLLAFLTVSLLSHYDNWDPVMDLVKRLYIWVCRRSRSMRIPDLEAEQTESLISVNSVNSENLLPTSQKYNVGSLRLPADPSWPKIPQRRLVEDGGDIIEPPCVVTLTGTPRRSRTIVRTPHAQSTKVAAIKEPVNIPFHRCHPKVQIPLTQPLKRRPGCTDPRFKRVTTVRSQMTSTDPAVDREIDKNAEMSRSTIAITNQPKPVQGKVEKTVPEKDTSRPQVTQQEAEKPGEIKDTESIPMQPIKPDVTVEQESQPKTIEPGPQNLRSLMSPRKPSPRLSPSPKKSTKQSTPRPENTPINLSPRNGGDAPSTMKDTKNQDSKCINNDIGTVPNLKILPNMPVNLQSQTPPLQYCQGSDGQFFLVVEKKVQSTPMNAVQIDPSSMPNCQYTTQCYNVQVPVLSYQNVPVQISTQTQPKVDIPPQLSQTPVLNFQSSPLLNKMDIPKLELPKGTVPQFTDSPDSSIIELGKQSQCKKVDIKMEQMLSSELQKQVAQQKLQLEHEQFQKHKHRHSLEVQRDFMNFQRKTEVQLVSCKQSSHRTGLKPQFQSSPEPSFADSRKKQRSQPQSLHISPRQRSSNVRKNSDPFLTKIPRKHTSVHETPQHNFHIHYQQVDNAQQYQQETTDSEFYSQEATQHQNYEGHGQQHRPNEDSKHLHYQQETTDSDFYVHDNVKSQDQPNSGQQFHEDPEYSPVSLVKQKHNTDPEFETTVDNTMQKKPPTKHDMYFKEYEHRPESSSHVQEVSNTQEKYKGAPVRQKRKMKSEQYLSHLEAQFVKKYTQCSEPHITIGQRRSMTPHLRKSNSYFSKSTQHLMADSDSTLIWSGYQQSRRRHNHRQYPPETADLKDFSLSQELMYQTGGGNVFEFKQPSPRLVPHPTDLDDTKRVHFAKPYQRPPQENANAASSLDLQKQNAQQNKSPRADTDIPIEKPTAIPVKTQQLLNKSYWDYYNKLKLHKMENGESAQQQYFCQVAMGAPQSKRRRSEKMKLEGQNDTSQCEDQMDLSLPEIRTLEQCSVLSSMINKNLGSTLQPSSETTQTKQLYLNGNMKSSSDPTGGTQSAVLKKFISAEQYEDSVFSSTPLHRRKHKREKHMDKRVLKLKTIGEHPVVFFGCMMYAMIVFLPMIYDYLFYEEYDDYEDLSYIEIVLEYIFASFKEAFGGFFEMVNKIFFRPKAWVQR